MIKYLKWAIIAVMIAAVGIFLLSQIGGVLISEVIEEIKTEERQDPDAALKGKTTPYFELPELSGATVKITDFLDGPVVVLFWTTWNQNSADQLKILDDYVRINGDSLFKVIAIASQEDKSAVSNFISRGGYGLTVLLDENGAVGEKYGARNLPTTFFIDKDGFIRDLAVGVINDREILKKAESVIK